MKSIFLTASSTFAAMTLIGSIFMSSILGLFGLAAVPVKALQEMRAAQSVIQQMKDRHQARKANVTSKFANQTGKRLASSAVAALTVGTVAVTAAVAAIEMDDYCKEQQELQREANLLYGTDTVFELDDCYEQAKEDVGRLSPHRPHLRKEKGRLS